MKTSADPIPSAYTTLLGTAAFGIVAIIRRRSPERGLWSGSDFCLTNLVVTGGFFRRRRPRLDSTAVESARGGLFSYTGEEVETRQSGAFRNPPYSGRGQILGGDEQSASATQN